MLIQSLPCSLFFIGTVSGWVALLVAPEEGKYDGRSRTSQNVRKEQRTLLKKRGTR
jgi:hypothetical protein